MKREFSNKLLNDIFIQNKKVDVGNYSSKEVGEALCSLVEMLSKLSHEEKLKLTWKMDYFLIGGVFPISTMITPKK